MFFNVLNSLAAWAFLPRIPVLASFLVVIFFSIFFLVQSRGYFGKFSKYFSDKKLILFFIGFTLFYNTLLSALQYFVWHNSDFSKFFLPPFTPISYFLSYSFHHFWLDSLLAIIFALLIYLVFYSLRLFKKRTLSSSDERLILLFFLPIPWPGALLMLPLFLFLLLIFSLSILLIFKSKKVVFFWPLLISFLISFLLVKTVF